MGIYEEIKRTLGGISEQNLKETDELIESARGHTFKQKLKENWESLKTALKEFGYSIGKGMSPKDSNSPTQAEATPTNPRVTESTTSQALINTLMEMDNTYRKEQTGVDFSIPTLPHTTGQTQKEYIPKTDEELKAQAESELLPDYQAKESKAEQKLESTTQRLESEQADLTESYESTKTELDADYQKATTAHRDNMIFRGLVNSTINQIGTKNLADSYNLEHTLIDQKYDREYQGIQEEKRLAELEFNSAMASYDLNYSADLQEKLQKLREQEEKRLEQINKYNLSVRLNELEYQRERAATLKELQQNRQKSLYEAMEREREQEEKYGISPEKQAEYQRRTEMAKTFYSNFSREQASQMIGDSAYELLNLLGKDSYFALLYWNGAR